mmetsp:Transcript_55485/g.125038  ORF Transcript_55485/g.125038 Transcript_55485/m.125038 type:complete len:622 (-) Transcript_55485:203-2068(-)
MATPEDPFRDALDDVGETGSVEHLIATIFPDHQQDDDSLQSSQSPTEHIAKVRKVLVHSHSCALRCLEPCMESLRRFEAEEHKLRRENEKLRSQLSLSRANFVQDHSFSTLRESAYLPGEVPPSPPDIDEPPLEFKKKKDAKAPMQPCAVWAPNTPLQPSAFPPTEPQPVLDADTSTQYGDTFDFRLAEDDSMRRMRARTIFADVNAMKEQVRQKICVPDYNVSHFYWERGIWQQMARSSVLETFTMIVIAANAVWLAVDTDLNHTPLLTDAPPLFQAAEHFFCTYFFVEWIIRFQAFKRKRDGLKDVWFTFDTALMALTVIETWGFTIMVVLLLEEARTNVLVANAPIVRIVRLLRLTRMARMAKLLRLMPELVILIKGMATAARSVMFTLLLLGVLIYVFAIAFTQLCKGTSLQHTLFSGVLRSMSTLLLTGTVPDLVMLVERDLAGEHIIFAVLFFVFILLSSLTLMNLLVGVLVEVVSVVSLVEKENLDVRFVKSYFSALVKQVDIDGDQQISKGEFGVIMQNPDALRALQSVGVDVVGLVDLADFIFRESENLPFRDFMDLILQLRGANKATVRDIVDMRKLVVQKVANLENRVLRAIAASSGRLSIKESDFHAGK